MTTSNVVVVAATPLEATLIHSSSATLLISGVGAVNAAHALTQYLSMNPAPSLVIQTGIAGAYVPANISVGSVVLADTEIYGDLGVLTPDGWRPMEEIGMPLLEATASRVARFNYFPLDAALVNLALTASGPLVARTGKFLML